MRSSDWSSDVCSSDLAHTTPHQRGNRRVAGPPRRTIHHPPRARRTRAMSVIGTFTPVKDGGWAGTIRTLTIEVKARFVPNDNRDSERSEEHTSELQSLMRISYAVFCLKKKTNT